MISYITPYYENAGMLAEQLAKLGAFPDHLKGAVEYIVVDDGSPTAPAIDTVRRFHRQGWLDGIDLKVFRIGVDVRWNHIAARNIGAHHATHGWLMLTDIDHVVPSETFGIIMGKLETLDKRRFYTFDRVDAPHLTPYKPHPHTWLMYQSLWNKFGGYDERFSGHYGMDFLARERLLELAEQRHLNLPVIRYAREVIPDASTVTYERKSAADRQFVKAKRAELIRDGTYRQPVTLSFPYERVWP